jgi:hypothetical protein
MADARPNKTRKLTIEIEVSSDVKLPSDHEMVLIAAAATGAMATKAKEKGLKLDNLITKG